ncbi:TPA: helix-turn-helix domain-containing protein [Klebsiella variicola]|uniref:helix-turn-helix domain-containing protein n=1 Tax=Klebsiella quasipneumoniae TaxID=1463165 RepID=UPI00236A9E56|nr:helix-turn-helix domain-containing protein [Klebsiella variicola]HBS7662484.1 helix-turn-helix domain-containing protein [Klebsiella pneumoniae]HBT1431468.1 helix-turn-helix domain-containing protein [Klebsiella pneumoniae]HDK6344430.1 helix-turn-helix domain-containing protein [Klebsiella quasipneumoniae]
MQLLKIEMTKNTLCRNLLPMVEKSNKHQDFADRLNQEMSKKNLSVKQLSHAGQVTYEMARRYTLGTAKPRDEKLIRIAEWLNVPPAWLDYGAVENVAESNIVPEASNPSHPDKADETEFTSLSDEEKRLIRVFRKFPDAEANNMLLAFEIRYKKLLEFYSEYADPGKK